MGAAIAAASDARAITGDRDITWIEHSFEGASSRDSPVDCRGREPPGLPACSKLPDMFGSEPKSSTACREVMAEGSRAVGAAASERGGQSRLDERIRTGSAGRENPSAEQPPAPKAARPRLLRPRVRTQSKVTAAAKPTAPIESVQPNAEPVVTVIERSRQRDRDRDLPDCVTDGAGRTSPIYSKDDPDVIPARLLMTKECGTAFPRRRPEMNTMELVVSRQGRVEQVRMITPARTMTDMLLLSGAKTWKFTPALKEGQPVRYRTMFSWESTP